MSARLVLRTAALLAILALTAQEPRARACSAFSARTTDGILVAKSFDWPAGEGWIVANERGRQRSKLVPGGSPEVASWTARFASVSFSTIGPGFPISGMNEAGLTIEALVDASAATSVTPDPARLTGLELVQYGLDRFEAAEDLAAFAERSGVSQLAVALHFFACDRGGACVVIESRTDGVHALRGADLRVRALANRPFQLDAHTAPLSTRVGSSGERFAVMAQGLVATPPRDVDDAFRLLESVRIPRLTKWQIVWNATDSSVHFRDHAGAGVFSLRLDASSMPCSGPPRVRAIGHTAGPEPATFLPWSDVDAARAERGVVAQVGARTAAARHLAAAVAAATLATTCGRLE